MAVLKDGAIGYLIFDNPAVHNAIDAAMRAQIPAIIDDFEADPAIRIVVVRGAGEKTFVSGANITDYDRRRAANAAEADDRGPADMARHRLRECKKPTIAMIRGYCLGGGVGIALACDLRVASESAQFGVPAARLGNGYGASGIGPLMQAVGAAMAKEILFTGQRYSAAEARSMGLVHRVVPDDELEIFTRDYAQTIADNAPLTIHAAKQVIHELQKDEKDRDMKELERLRAICLDSEDHREGRAAFKEKRKPVFKGR
jgi:enoyl-CoA hydratase/carnithine racemase